MNIKLVINVYFLLFLIGLIVIFVNQLIAIVVFGSTLIILVVTFLYLKRQVSGLSQILVNRNHEYDLLKEGPFGRVVYELDKIVKEENYLKESFRKDQLNQHKMVTEVTHQMKTPLSTMKLANELFLSNPESVDMALLEKEREKIESYLNILNSFSRVENGAINIKVESSSITKTIIESINSIYLKAKEKAIIIESISEQDFDIAHDKFYTKEVIINVLENALKYGKDNSKITIEVDESPSFYRVVISNQGTNILSEDVSRIFERFYRGENASNIEGMGVGLFLCKEIMKLQNGSIRLENKKTGTVSFVLVFYKY